MTLTSSCPASAIVLGLHSAGQKVVRWLQADLPVLVVDSRRYHGVEAVMAKTCRKARTPIPQGGGIRLRCRLSQLRPRLRGIVILNLFYGILSLNP